MRIEPIAPNVLSEEQRGLHDRMAQDVDRFFSGFIVKREDGALLGPFPPLLRFPHFGQPAWEYVRALLTVSALPRRAREVATLVTATSFSTRYELYAHERVAAQVGLSISQITAIERGERPLDLEPDELIAHDTANALVRGKTLSEAEYASALSAFGERGVAELVFLVAGYSMLSLVMNAYDVPLPREAQS